MRILLLSPWKNVWVDYMDKYFVSKGVQMDFQTKFNFNELTKYDCVISGWTDQYAKALGDFPKLADKYICFLRSYEYYTGIFRSITWTNFDCLFFLNQHIMSAFNGCIKERDRPKMKLTRNGIDLERIKFIERKKGKNVLMLANINEKKGILLLVQIALSLPDYDFYVAGKIQDPRFGDYILNLAPKNVKFLGYQEDLNKLFQNMNYILCCSPAEGNPNNIIEGMAAGLKPVVHRFLGHSGQFPGECCYTTIDECADIISGDYDPTSYRKWIEDHYDMSKVYDDIFDQCKRLDK